MAWVPTRGAGVRVSQEGPRGRVCVARLAGGDDARGLTQAFALALLVLSSGCAGRAGGAARGGRCLAEPPVAEVAERAVKAVVNISATRLGRTSGSPLFSDPFFRHFFRGFGVPRARRQRSLGSGVIVSKRGIVVTNYHVVRHGAAIQVRLFDGRALGAKLVGSDPKSDLAVLQLQGPLGALHPLPFGDSDQLRLGDPVLAIGNPFGVGQTVTKGIVSAKGRANIGIVDYEDFIQTDAAINPGNSGGALVALDGSLVGINTAILSRSGGNQGIGLAIPARMAQQLMESILAHGRVVRGWLGLRVQTLTPELAAALGAGEHRGVVVAEVLEGSPAAAGLKRGDVLLKVGGSAVTSAARYRSVVASAGAGRRVELSYLREGRLATLSATLGQMPTTIGGVAQLNESAGSLGGLTVVGLSDAVRDKYGLAKGLKLGVVVERVGRDSRAARLGLRPGDVILEINRNPVASVADFERLYRSGKGPRLLVVMRGGRTYYLLLR